MTIVDDINQVSNKWDSIYNNNPLKSKIFLKHVSVTNPLPQKYIWSDCTVNSVAGCLYKAPLLFALGKWTFSKDAAWCGLPLSFSTEPAFSPQDKLLNIAQEMNHIWPGFQVILGLDNNSINIPGWSWKRHFTAFYVDTKYKDFDAYLGNIRYSYLNQIKKSLSKWSTVDMKISSGADFNYEAYNLYLSVLNKQKYKANQVGINFFTDIPIKHHYINYLLDNKLLGWILVIPYGNNLYALLMGIDQVLNQQYDIYFNILLGTIRYAISNGYQCLSLGQLADLTKMRLGGLPKERYILVRHTNPQINQIIKNTDIFNYRKRYKQMRVLKNWNI